MPLPQVSSSRGQIQLGAELGRGGEGAVYEVVGIPGTVAKVYHKPASSEKAEKLSVMVSMATPQLLALTAWPTDVLRHSNGTVYGLLMPRIEGYKDVHSLYGPKSRRSEFPEADWRHLVRTAANTARAFAVLHDLGCVVGDVNHGGIKASRDTTVKLIDCDSFQISKGAKHYLCDVGVENFTPPELQGKPFQGVLRTPNHDNFGLAVIIFNLLMMGRHPFAGKYAGRDEMPVELAIAQYRYAYGRDAAVSLMEPPPHTPSVLVASQSVAELWERAFSRAGAVPNRRPSARDWVAALATLEKTSTRCLVNPGHHYLTAYGSCPWCPIEKASGTLLFAIPVVAGFIPPGGVAFNIDVAWSRITAIRLPDRVIEPQLPTLTASNSAMRIAGRRRRGQYFAVVLRGLTAIGVLALTYVMLDLWPLWILVGVVAWFVVGRAGKRAVTDIQSFAERRKKADAAYQEARTRWMSEGGSDPFIAKLRELEVRQTDLRDLPNRRQSEYARLTRDRQKNELRRFLEKFEIESATIPGVGPAKRSMLASYNIETAADVEQSAILNVPGFGPAMVKKLEKWRHGLEQQFRFNPNIALDPRDVADLDRRIDMEKRALEKALQDGPAELVHLREQIVAQRNALQKLLEAAAAELAQSEADLKAVS